VTPSSTIPDPVVQVAERLAGAPIVAIEEVRKGGNSRIFKVTTPTGACALKKYPPDDNRDRQGAEARALSFFARAGIGRTPRLLAADHAARISLLSWLDGTALAAPADDDIARFAAFQVALDRAIDEKARREIGPAAEACVSGARILAHIHARHGRLAALGERLPELRAFLAARFLPLLAAAEERARRLYRDSGLDFECDRPGPAQTLIASDFGAHNALRAPDGAVLFLDFEYFGWDDPLTSIGNFVLHPGMELTARQRAIYQDAVLAHFGPAHAQRLAALLPLYALRWCAIVLSELLPERLAHRSAANALAGDRDDIKTRQLAKADRLLAPFEQEVQGDQEGRLKLA
jgi:Phosphotransferase enzyme family